ncbi:MAG: hypothetical protein C5B49_07400 [Bdellovibrio sp.]|nr:MAG: hypothetical protein C5B49_07400 [Bdellovibrio sp.]
MAAVEASPQIHPCQRCGACCGYFRVEFDAWEADPRQNENSVPAELAERAGEGKLCMIGTNVKSRPKCIALGGRIGERVMCTIYQNRSTPCRDFHPSFEEGKHNARCDEARRRYGLKPLRPADYPTRDFPTPAEIPAAPHAEVPASQGP